MLIPLKQFICDTCGQIIEKPSDGWLEWITDPDDDKAHSFRITHHQTATSLTNAEGCYQNGDAVGRSDDHLDHILANPMAELLFHLDIGPYHNPSYSGPLVRDMREYVEIVRRLTIPHYEEARIYWHKALSDGYFADANEIYIYTQDFLRGLIQRYGSPQEPRQG